MKRIKKTIPFVVTIIICTIISVSANYLYDSSNVYYDNTNSELTSNNVQSAIDELYPQAVSFSELSNKIKSAETKVGNDTITANAQTLTSAINKMNSKSLKWQTYGSSYNYICSTSYTTVGPISLPPGVSFVWVPFVYSSVKGVKLYSGSESNSLYYAENFSGTYTIPMYIQNAVGVSNIYAKVRCTGNTTSSTKNYIRVYHPIIN